MNRRLKWHYANKERSIAITKAWQKAHPDQVRQVHAAWCIAHPESVKQYKRNDYQLHRVKRLGRNKQWRLSNRVTSNTIKKNYKHRKRAVSSVNCSEKINLLLKERFCRWCCCELTEANRVIDHIIPLSRGGLHIPDNLAASCRSCNASKHNKFVEDWLPSIGNYWTQ